MNLSKDDIVVCKNFRGIPGLVTRVAKDKTWADVIWLNGINKRMKAEVLEKIGHR